MPPPQAVVREPTIFDAPENRFPLALEVRIPKIQALLHSAAVN